MFHAWNLDKLDILWTRWEEIRKPQENEIRARYASSNQHIRLAKVWMNGTIKYNVRYVATTWKLATFFYETLSSFVCKIRNFFQSIYQKKLNA